MRLQKLIRDANSTQLEEYLSLMRGHPCDQDRVDIGEMIIELGLTPYQAARRRFDSGASNRSFGTLYYHAKAIAQDLSEYLGFRVQDALAELASEEVIYYPIDMLGELKAACADMGFEVEVDARVRLLRRTVGANWREVPR